MSYDLDGTLGVHRLYDWHVNALELSVAICDRIEGAGFFRPTVKDEAEFVEVSCIGNWAMDDEIARPVCPAAQIRISKSFSSGHGWQVGDASCLRLRRRLQGKYKIDRGIGIKMASWAWCYMVDMVIKFFLGEVPENHGSHLPQKAKKEKNATESVDRTRRDESCTEGLG